MARYPYREIIEMASIGIAMKKVAFLCGCGPAKVSAVTTAAKQMNIAWPIPLEHGDDELEALLDPIDLSKRFQPDFTALEKALGHKLSSRDEKSAYRAYLESAGSSEKSPYTESSFKSRFREWLAEVHPALGMNVNWQKGEELQLDWAGKKIMLTNASGKQTPAFLFVATSPYSDYTFIRASLDMGMQSWLEHCIKMFEFFEGVPLFLAIDNLATGVSFDNTGKRKINAQFQALADHYDCMVVPARFYSPCDKAAVEGHVRIMANRIIGVLSQQTFSSIDVLNESIDELCRNYNNCIMHRYGRSRREIFEEERLCMQSLPDQPYEPITWKKHKVSFDGVVRIKGNYYGVPEQYANQRTQVKISDSTIEVHTIDKKQCIAIHQRKEDGAETFEGFAGTHPDRFRKLDDWAQGHGRLELLSQWDAEKNEYAPSDLVCRSKKEVAWKCPDCGYEWSEQIVRRTSRSFDDCPRCAHMVLVPGETDLQSLYPEATMLWDAAKNPFGANEVFPDSSQTYWWRGECGHAWRARVSDMVRSAEGRLCPVCMGTQLADDGTNSIAVLLPDLAKHWHPTKNHGLKPESTPIGYPFEVYLWNGMLSRIFRKTPRAWAKQHGFDGLFENADVMLARAIEHDIESQWVPTPTECLPRGKAVVKWSMYARQFDLRLTLAQWCEHFNRQDLIAEWDYERNDIDPKKVSRSSNTRVWWCGKCGHSWLESIRNRTYYDAGCIYCNRRRALEPFSSVAALDASLLKQWHPSKNGKLTPERVTDRTHELIWWQCPTCGYEWQEALRKTNEKSRKCPACNRRPQYAVPGKNTLDAKRPELVKTIDTVLNGDIDPSTLQTKMKRKLWWRWRCGHVWLQRIDLRAAAKGNPCPYCSGRKLLRGLNDLATVSPLAAALLHPEKNNRVRADSIRANSSKKLWWLGACGHSWQASVSRMVRTAACPICAGDIAVAGENDLATTHPALAAQWASELNEPLQAKDITFHSSRYVWWRCELSHTWQAPPNRRAKHDTGCPVCGNRVLLKGFNDLKSVAPKIAKEWDKERNGTLKPRDVRANSSKKVWWRCKQGHSWQAIINNRVALYSDCPYCANHAVLAGYNDLKSQYPEIAAELHPHHNHGLKAEELLATSTKIVWWHASCGHVWKAQVCARTRSKKHECPICAGRLIPERPIKTD